MNSEEKKQNIKNQSNENENLSFIKKNSLVYSIKKKVLFSLVFFSCSFFSSLIFYGIIQKQKTKSTDLSKKISDTKKMVQKSQEVELKLSKIKENIVKVDTKNLPIKDFKPEFIQEVVNAIKTKWGFENFNLSVSEKKQDSSEEKIHKEIEITINFKNSSEIDSKQLVYFIQEVFPGNVFLLEFNIKKSTETQLDNNIKLLWMYVLTYDQLT